SGNIGDQGGNDFVYKGGQLQFHENPPGLCYVGHQQPELAECPGVHKVQRPEVYSRVTQSGGNLVKAAWRILNGYDKLLELHKVLSFPETSDDFDNRSRSLNFRSLPLALMGRNSTKKTY